MSILQDEMGEVMILNRGKDSYSYGIRLTFSQADKTIFCFDMKELQWESYMDSSVGLSENVKMKILKLVTFFLL